MAPCSIKWCGKDSRNSNFKNDGLTFHRYPKDAELKKKWIKATRRENWSPSEYSVICSRHFTEDCFLKMKNRRRLLSSAVPSRLLPLLGDIEETECTLATPDLKTAVSKTSSSPGRARTPEPKKRKQSSDSPSTLLAPQYISETSTNKKRKTVCDSASNYDTPTEKRLCRRIIELSDKVVQKNRQIKNYIYKISYLKKRLSSLKSIVEKLKKKSLVAETKTQ